VEHARLQVMRDEPITCCRTSKPSMVCTFSRSRRAIVGATPACS
jgi:hypothetical protein